MHVQRSLFLMSFIAAATALSSCNGVGSGSRPTSLIITPGTGALLGSNSHKVFLCFPQQMGLIVLQDNGDYNPNFAYRATWTSSNPDVAAVSNGDILYPGTTTSAYANGTVIPKTPGTTKITAQFSELSASVDLTVEAPDEFSIVPANPSLAQFTNSPINAQVVVDGYTQTVTTLGDWTFPDQADADPNVANPLDDIVKLAPSSSGISLVAGPTVGSRVVQVKFPSCPEGSDAASRAANLTTTVNTRVLKTLTITPEFLPDQPLNYITNGATKFASTETMKVTGGFEDVPETQEMPPALIDLNSSDPTVLAPYAGYVAALKAGSATVTATFRVLDAAGETLVGVTSLPVTVLTGERTLSSIAISPAEPQTIYALDHLQYHAIGTFTDNTTQDITRSAVWTVSDAAIITIGNGSTIPSGEAFSLRIPDQGTESVNVMATVGANEDAKTATPVSLTVRPRP